MLRPNTDPLRALEERGGEVWAFRYRHGAVMRLSNQGTRAEGITIRAAIWRSDVGSDGAALRALGWRPTDVGLERTWTLQSDLDRSSMRRDLDQAIAILAARRGASPGDFPLTHRSPADVDGGYGQVGCLLAVLSTIVGEVAGIVAVVILEPGPVSILGVGIAFVAGAFVVPLTTGEAVPAVAGRSERFRAQALNVGYVWLLIAPAVVAAGTIWIMASLGL